MKIEVFVAMLQRAANATYHVILSGLIVHSTGKIPGSTRKVRQNLYLEGNISACCAVHPLPER